MLNKDLVLAHPTPTSQRFVQSHNQLVAESGFEFRSIYLFPKLSTFTFPTKRQTANIYRELCVSLCCKCFIRIISFNPPPNPMR